MAVIKNQKLKKIAKNPDMVLGLNYAVDYLWNTEFFVMPVRKVYEFLLKSIPRVKFSIDELIEEMMQDDRFRIFSASKLEKVNNLKILLSTNGHDRTGVYSEPNVMLVDRVPTRREVLTYLLSKANQTFEVLKKTWDYRPKDDVEIEDQLLYALAKSQKLQRELREILSGESVQSEKIALK